METSNPPSVFPARGPRLIPVLDIMGGQVVRAVGGRRGEYRPVRSVLTDSTEPGEVARALVAATGATWLYVADLDAIVHARPDVASVRAVAITAGAVLCDGGFRTADDAARYARSDCRCVVGTETGSLAVVSAVHMWNVGVSLDLRGGRLVGDGSRWGGTPDPVAVAGRAIDAGAAWLIVLDLDRVGTGCGPGTEPLIARLKHRHPGIDMYAGGGVRTRADIDRLGDAGADAVLVASALHDGSLLGGRPA